MSLLLLLRTPALFGDADASSPPLATANSGSTVTTASFTPAANSVLEATAWHDTAGGNTTNTSKITDSTDPAGALWTIEETRNKADSGGQNGHVQLSWRAIGASPVAMTVTTTGTNTAGATALSVRVIPGADTTAPIDVKAEGSNAAGVVSVALPASVAANTRGVVANVDWNVAAAPTPGTGQVALVSQGIGAGPDLRIYLGVRAALTATPGTVETMSTASPASGNTNNYIAWSLKQAAGGTTHNATGTAAGSGAASGSATVTVAAAGTAAGAGGAAGAAARDIAAAGTATGVTTAAGTAALALAGAGTAQSTSAATGSAALTLTATATTSAISTATGSASVTLTATGTTASTGSATGVAALAGAAATGTAAGVTASSGAATVDRATSGAVAGVGGATGTATIVVAAIGTASGVSSAAGATGAAGVAGTAAGVSSATGTATIVPLTPAVHARTGVSTGHARPHSSRTYARPSSRRSS